jgi:hypothetical protein
MNRVLYILTLLALTSCTHLPVAPVSYERTATIQSSKIVAVGLSTAAASGTSGRASVPLGGGVSMPMALGPYPHLMFTEEDQRIFAESFKTELGRLGILRLAGPSDTTPLKIAVVFVHTEHKYDFNDYILDVDVLFTSNGKEEKKSYHVVSSEGDSWFARMNTRPSEGKKKAASKLMAKIVPDVQEWIKR